MARGALARHAAWVLPALALAALLVVTVLLTGDLERDAGRLGALAPWLAGAALVAVVVLLGAIALRIAELVRQRRRDAPGARLAIRWAVSLVLLAVPPLVLLYGFSLKFLNDSVETFFNVRVERALDDALALGRAYLDAETGRALSDSAALAARLEAAPADAWQDALEAELDRAEVLQAVVFGAGGSVIAIAANDPRLLLPTPPDSAALLRVRDGAVDAASEPLGDDLVIRVQRSASGNLLRVIYDLPADVKPLARNIEESWADYQRLALLRGALKLTFNLLLTAVLLFAAFLAVLAALGVARRQIAPLARLAAATRAVGSGAAIEALPTMPDDELGFLTRSFNQMADDLAAADARARRSQRETERQRASLDALLTRLSSGVIAIDAGATLGAINPAALAILGVPLEPARGAPLAALSAASPRLAPLVALIAGRAASGAREWTEELALAPASDLSGGANQRLLLRAAALPADADGRHGHVVVFDDAGDLSRAEREAAWLSVAERLAHEVKNPLTPIQLATERLSLRLSPKLDAADREVLVKSTTTIVSQVAALKAMVDAFADYARPPTIQLSPLALNPLVDAVLELYDDPARVRIVRTLDPSEPTLRGDALRLRQLLHNLVKNALEASSGVPEITVSTAASGDDIELAVADRGQGLPAGFDASWFEPYRTSKAKGTGLGLSVVRKVAEEHGGRVSAAPRDGGGAVFTVTLPRA